MITLQYVLALLLGYLLGSSNMAFYISKLKKTDIASLGSRNLGTANTLTVCGWKASLLVLVHDLGKSVLAVVGAYYLFRDAEYAGVVAGVACVLGHIFPFYLKFRGGKGYASYLGLMLSLDWKYTLISFAITVAVVVASNYMMMGNLITVVPFPAYLALRGKFVEAILVAMLAAVVVFKHRSHLVALAHGKEDKFFDSIRRKHTQENEEEATPQQH